MGRIADFIEKRYSLADMDRDMDAIIYGMPTATGLKVSGTKALTIVSYYHGMRLRSETVGQVPLIEYRRVMRGNNRQGKERATGEKLYNLLHDTPNPEMDAISFKSALQGHVIGWGNAFAEIEWDMSAGEVRALWPLNVSRMKVGRDDKTRELIYAYTTPDSVTHILPPFRVLHIPGFGFDGIIGYDSVYLAREMLGLTMALEEHGARFFGNGARPGGILTHPNHLGDEAKKANIKHWQEQYGGLSNVNRIAILDEGITYKEIGIPPENSQYLQSRTFSIQEMSRLLNITPHKMYELSHATFSNIEHQDLEYMKYTMGPDFRRWEQACNRKLILPAERSLFFCEFLEDALLRADSAARAAFYKELFYMGSLSPNDIREKENMNPNEDPSGDRYYIPSNFIPMDMAERVALGQAREAATPKQLRSEKLKDVIKIVAKKEKESLLRAAKRDPDDFNDWLISYYKDFTGYIRQKLEPLLGDSAEYYTLNYIERSIERLKNIDVSKIEIELLSWEDRRAFEYEADDQIA